MLGNIDILLSALVLIVSFCLMLRQVRTGHDPRHGWGARFYFAGLLLLAADIVAEGIVRHRVPIQTLSDSLRFFALVILIVDAAMSYLATFAPLSLFLLPVVIGFELLSVIFFHWPPGAGKAEPGNTFLASHVLLFLLSYTCFFLAAAFGLMFIALSRVLKAHNYGAFWYRMMPGLARLDRAGFRGVVAGLVLLTVAMLLAFEFLRQYALTRGLPRIAPLIIGDVTILTAMAVWLYYALCLFARMRLGWVGRRFAYATVTGLMFIAASYLVSKAAPPRTLHGYGKTPPGQTAAAPREAQ